MSKLLFFRPAPAFFLGLLFSLGALLPGAERNTAHAAAENLPENAQVKVISAEVVDCYVYQARCLRITVMCKIFLPLGRPILEVSWLEPDGTPFYTVVKHVAGTAHCNLGDLIHRYVPGYEGRRYTIRLL